MLGWMIIFAILSGLGLGLGQSSEIRTVTAGNGLTFLFGLLFTLTFLIRCFSRHSS